MSNGKEVSVLLVGCGAPLKSMGAYHAIQLLDGRIPHAKLQYIVEPWYCNDKARGSPGYDEFHSWKTDLETNSSIRFFSKVTDVPPPFDGEIRLVIISARTSDNPALLEACVTVGCHAIYLEKPGAPTVRELETMRDQAVAGGVTVHLGFNKNVSSYLTHTRAFVEQYEQDGNGKKCDITFLHNNNYRNVEDDLAECFERNAEGILKNMAIHELAILVTYYGVSVDTIATVQADKAYSSLKTLIGPSSGKQFTDFDKIKFKIVTKAGIEINVAADRCGGDDSVGIVSDVSTGMELARYSMPDEETTANIPTLKAKYGDAMPYFFTQDPDYALLKILVVRNCLDGTPAPGVANIDVAIDTLKIAEYLTPILQDQLR
jgi:predicted dehydrogenase